ncbi:MAG: dienelactone hydrolase [Thermoflexales bacterium]
MIRSLYSAARVDAATAPYDTIHLKIYYPAELSGSQDKHMSDNVVPRKAGAPFPVLVFFNAINLGPEAYHWLAVALAERGLAVATFGWVGETIPGVIGLTSGIDLDKVRPDTYGSGPSSLALGPILNALNALNENAPWARSPLAGALDLDAVVLGGHSAGGTVVLQNADNRYFPGVRGAFSYGGHTLASPMLGFPAGTVLTVSDTMPLLLIGGTRDGVIAANAARYQVEDAATHDPIGRTFDEAIGGARGDRHLWMIDGANHFTIAHPIDDTAGRGFPDLPAEVDETAGREHMARVIGDFALSVTRGTNFVPPFGSRSK